MSSTKQSMIDISLMRRLFAADPNNLPQIFAHPTAMWKGPGGAPAPVRVDRNNNLHMAIADLLQLKKELPLEYVERRGDTLVFKIALEPHHLAGGSNDRLAPAQTRKERKMGLRDRLGFDPIDGGPKRTPGPHVVLKQRPRLRVKGAQ